MKWKKIDGYRDYEVSDEGIIRKKTIKGFFFPVIGKWNHGYRRVCLNQDGEIKQKSIHRLVLEAFVGSCPDGMEACHNDGNKNNNHLSNLRWDTYENNRLDKLLHGTEPHGEACHNAVFNEEDIHFIRHMIHVGISDSVIASFYNTKCQTIQAIRYGKTWTYLETKPLSLEENHALCPL